MFEHIPASEPDAILALMQQFRTDQREGKVDLGVGVYKDGHGQTPVLRAIKKAEQQLHARQDSKTYVSPTGDAEFCTAMLDLVFGKSADKSTLRAMQTPGGSGALRVLSDLLSAANPDARTWVSDPTWPNHLPMLRNAGHNIVEYPYYDSKANRVDFDAMMGSLEQAEKGDIVLLHGCCHNPTGADLDASQWASVAELFSKRGLFPFIDLAYQGFARGLEEDVEGVRILADKLPELAIATSCSKNLALYRERAGAAILQAGSSIQADNTLSKAVSFVRSNYSMPPDHGAAMTRMVLLDDTLRADWSEELESMRMRMVRLRAEFADALRKRSNSDQFDYIAEQHGMFSRLPLSTAQVDQLREEHGIYMVGDGRINVAGLPEGNMDELAAQIVAVLD